jgi:hypothetical protein
MFVASRLAYEHKLHVELTKDNAPWVDLLVSTEDGTQGVGVQVKVARDAVRYRGRGQNRKPSFYEWETGKRLMTVDNPNLLVVLVDLKQWRETPDYFIVKVQQIQKYYQHWQTNNVGKDPGRWIYKPDLLEIEPLKNEARPLLEHMLGS